MNENPFKSLRDSSDDEALSRSIDRFADGECNAVEEAKLFDRLDATPGAWKQCALALAEDRDLRAALAGVGRTRVEVDPFAPLDEKVTLAVPSPFSESPAPRGRSLLSWAAVSLGLILAFGLGFVVAPLRPTAAPTLAGGNVSPPNEAAPVDDSNGGEGRQAEAHPIASRSRPELAGASSRGPDIVNVVYRSSGAGEESSAPLPVYKSNEDWARALTQVVRLSEADLAERRAQLLAQGADLERQIVLHPVTTEQGEMLLPVETFQIVPVSRKSFH